jgi:hypothetical protein
MSRSKLLYKPEQYAKDAINAIEHQLKTVKSEKRRSRLVAKLNMWKKTLDVLGDDNA